MLTKNLIDVLRLHAEWLQSKGEAGRRANLSAADLRMTDLSAVDLSHALLIGANLERANLRGSRLARADLRQANLDYALLERADFCGANLTHVTACGANLDDGLFRDTLLSKANFDDSRCKKTDFSGARGTLVRFNRSDLTGAVLDGVNLEGAQFRDACLLNVTLIGASLTGANLFGADSSNVSFYGASLVDIVLEPGSYPFINSEEDIELSRGQKRRILRLHRRGASIAEIAELEGLPRATLRRGISQAEEAVSQNRSRQMARMFKTIGVSFFCVSAIALLVALLAGALDFYFTLVRGSPAGWTGAWYMLWVMLAVLGGIGGVGIFAVRHRLLGATKTETAVEEQRATNSSNETSALDNGPPPRGDAARREVTEA